jgi:hypothetical protein
MATAPVRTYVYTITLPLFILSLESALHIDFCFWLKLGVTQTSLVRTDPVQGKGVPFPRTPGE